MRLRIAFVILLIWCSRSSAQDPNLQTRLESILPTPRDTFLPPKKELVPVQKERLVPITTIERVELTDPEMVEVLRKKNKIQPLAAPPSRDELLKLMQRENEPTFRPVAKTITITKTVTELEERTVAPKPVVTLELPASYAYASNALTSNTKRVADRLRASGPELNVKVPLSGTETFAFYLNPGLVRYDDSTFRDGDALTSQVSLTKLLSQSYSHADVRNPGTARLELLAFKFGTLSSFLPGFVGPNMNFYTPSMEWSLRNIAVGTRLCGEGKGKVNCYFLNLSGSVNHTWADNSALDNTGVSGTATLGWNIKPFDYAP